MCPFTAISKDLLAVWEQGVFFHLLHRRDGPQWYVKSHRIQEEFSERGGSSIEKSSFLRNVVNTAKEEHPPKTKMMSHICGIRFEVF
jgi:hypothetical protein